MKRKKETRPRRAKGMGTITYLGEGRRKPYLAVISKETYGTYATEHECAQALLHAILNKENKFPDMLNSDSIKKRYTEFVYDMQCKNMLPEAVCDFPDMSIVNEMFKNKLIAEGSASLLNSQDKEMLADDIPTFKELWEAVYERVAHSKSEQWSTSMKSAFKKYYKIHDSIITTITVKMIQNCFDDAMHSAKGVGDSTLGNMKIVLANVYRESEKLRYTRKDQNPIEYIEYHSTGAKRNKRTTFTLDEIKKTLSYGTEEAKIVLLYIFTGMRPIELIQMKKEDVHLEEKYMVGGVKTNAGKGRIVPIHDIILPYVKHLLETNESQFLFAKTGNVNGYLAYKKLYKNLMSELSLNNHIEPYDTRYTFATLAKEARVEESARKKIMGHVCDLTDSVYTHESVEYFLNEINKIKIC